MVRTLELVLAKQKGLPEQ
ncbi:hypothetical protein HU200_006067 [Digitaria exilis]|uniref:Uncharacterized protein n=1 Tax=Digitaria exilis TaxID=1010633 RepID=A0A835B114_9POAL|nr:hypothetical protein HU200_043313 [Digitaria exilis]KAF8772074.1 hypothetical protein HU200_006067 [Digitaria exilis]